MLIDGFSYSEEILLYILSMDIIIYITINS